ncbi:FecR family protein [Peristeroidobacter soli]|uniref:FecR family protein n=1 Tax=Peristeroidobacter soli TaxID=2497877 RepID=UPI00101CB0FC|nr:FecR domain-containing protein [Peristeroidobacter soli]
MKSRETSQSVDIAASEWAAKIDNGPLTPQETAALKDWLEGDSRRPGALFRARAVSMYSESARALGPHYNPDDFTETPAAAPRLSRRTMLAWGGGLAASLAVTVGVGLSLSSSQAYATARGEMRLIPLGDGSTMLLNTATSVEVEFGSERRLVRVLEGETYFEVTADARRPFVVEVGGQQLGASASAFMVRRLEGGPVDVLVRSGNIELLKPGRATSLTANTHLAMTVRDDSVLTSAEAAAVAPEVLSRQLAWREGKIALHGETLAFASQAFARYSDVHIQITDPALANESITGLFSANDPVGFSRSVARIFGANLSVQPDAIVLSR